MRGASVNHNPILEGEKGGVSYAVVMDGSEVVSPVRDTPIPRTAWAEELSQQRIARPVRTQ